MFDVITKQCIGCKTWKHWTAFPADFRIDEKRIFASKRAETMEQVTELSGPPLYNTCTKCLQEKDNSKNIAVNQK